MIYVGHYFRWKPESPHLLNIARRWDYKWCRLWSDTSFEEMAEFFHLLRGKTWWWSRDGDSLPYYLLTPTLRERALRLGANIKDWDNPQLPPNTKPIYRDKKYIEKENENLSYQRETQKGTFSVLLAEEDFLKAAPVLRSSGENAQREGQLHPPINPDPSHQAEGPLPQ